MCVEKGINPGGMIPEKQKDSIIDEMVLILLTMDNRISCAVPTEHFTDTI